MNLNGLSNKVHILQALIDQEDIQLVCVTETHLTNEILSPFVAIPHFNLIRNDVKGSVHKHGVCAYVHEDLLTDNISFPVSNVLMFRLSSFNIHIILVYRPPSNDTIQNEELATFLEGVTTGKECIILGDFNLPSITWSTIEQCQPASPVPPMESIFLETFNSIGLIQWVSESTYPRSGNTLDLIFTSQFDCMGKVEVSQPQPSCDHCPVLFDYLCDGDRLDGIEPQVSKHRAWHKGRYSRMKERLAGVHWGLELAELSSSDAYDRLVVILQDLIKDIVPMRSENVLSKKSWKRNPPRSLTRAAKLAWGSYKATRAKYDRKSTIAKESFARFAELNRKVKSFQVWSQSQYELGLIARFKENPKFLHAYIRGKKSAQSCIGPLKGSGGQLLTDPQEMNECLASAFSDVYVSAVPLNQEPHQTFEGQIVQPQITIGEVETLLNSTDVNTAAGPDNIHSMVLRMCAQELSYPLYVKFSRSLREGMIPALWKQSLVVPIFKKVLATNPLIIDRSASHQYHARSWKR